MERGKSRRFGWKEGVRRHWSIFKQFVILRRKELFRTYVLVPIGVLLVMCLLYGVDRLIKNCIKVTFPASVAVMLINFAFMSVLAAFKKPYVEFYLGVIDVPLSWALRWMNVFFTPAFVTLPLSPWISCKEALLIVAVFLIGYLVAFVLLAYITVLGQKVTGSLRLRSVFVRQEELHNGMENGSRFAPASQYKGNDSISSSNVAIDKEAPAGEENRDSSSVQVFFGDSNGLDFHDPLVNLASNSGLSLSYVNSRATSSLGSEMLPKHEYSHHDDDNINEAEDMIQIGSSRRATASAPPNIRHGGTGLLQRLQPARHKNIETSSAVTVDSSDSRSICQRAITRQYSRQIDFHFSINMWDAHLHHVLYALGFFATIFTYYFQWYTTPFHFFTAVCMFMIITDSPFIVNRPRLKRLAHPVICSVALTWLVMLISVMIKHREVVFFLRELKSYKTGRTYLHLFDPSYGYHQWPGAGDIFSSCMDVSIVGLSLPMYTYRKDLKKHFFSMVPPILLFTAASLLLYPLICYNIGISSLRSIGFAGRSVTLALGGPMISNLGGDQTVMAVTTVMSGVVGALTGGRMLDFIRVPEEDYVTRGLALGCNCGAIATAYLLGVDRRAAAISSLSFVFYGALMVILSAIGPIKQFVHQLVGLN
ncbi:hypothetical protein HG536_0B03470 [Torulaspora globosa]|uniref:LrgB-like protein n=1 Tax=Torulaspora globosa TaxID=48254 RepID=A0A7G3ZD98_9SACH|nr:uncharacterized protein HG536_0B03470 [Torulaspora globosa]QLL31484.1 hypothetical protein HG536_0B03470 [Torulaspora globosa]